MIKWSSSDLCWQTSTTTSFDNQIYLTINTVISLLTSQVYFCRPFLVVLEALQKAEAEIRHPILGHAQSRPIPGGVHRHQLTVPFRAVILPHPIVCSAHVVNLSLLPQWNLHLDPRESRTHEILWFLATIPIPFLFPFCNGSSSVDARILIMTISMSVLANHLAGQSY